MSFQPLERMRFRVEDIIVKADQVWVRKYEIKVFQCLCHPKALSTISPCL